MPSVFKAKSMLAKPRYCNDGFGQTLPLGAKILSSIRYHSERDVDKNFVATLTYSKDYLIAFYL